MNFLEIAQFMRQECRIPGSGPSSVVSQTGQMKQVVDWVRTAWRDIQRLEGNWRWMRRPFSLTTVQGTGQYAYGSATDVDAGGFISRFQRWWLDDCRDPPLSYLQSGGVGQQYRLVWLEWDKFKWLYRFGTQNQSTPIHVSVDPQNRLCLGPDPNGIFVVTGEFQRGLQTLAANDDTPEMPADFHELIAYFAMSKYGVSSVAQEVVARADLEALRLLTALRRDQLPAMGMGEPLA